ncbi:MAG TPA: hypothetical protein VHC70_02870 [Phycisphaerales bacterium]|nr:hypothetical protein [Phycisphaerales bacterium]
MPRVDGQTVVFTDHGRLGLDWLLFAGLMCLAGGGCVLVLCIVFIRASRPDWLSDPPGRGSLATLVVAFGLFAAWATAKSRSRNLLVSGDTCTIERLTPLGRKVEKQDARVHFWRRPVRIIASARGQLDRWGVGCSAGSAVYLVALTTSEDEAIRYAAETLPGRDVSAQQSTLVMRWLVP